MRNWHYAVVGIAILGILAYSARASLYQTDNLNVAVPSENGTSTLLNVTSRMQQYVGFFGRIWAEVRLNTTAGSGTLYNKSVDRGMMYLFKAGATPLLPFSPASINATTTDLNFSLTGYYVTGNHFINNGTVCNISSAMYLNTTDNFMVGIFKDASTAPKNYFVCTDIRPVNSQNGFNTIDGNVLFEVIAPKTATYSAYDIWVDGELQG
ncbi:MAG TPA: hypothetical protein VJI13_01740 [Candidatus Norongarragalinales archaeon]|nr:hypothetical protein [Candidatus Norongarragalinales archaeon]